MYEIEIKVRISDPQIIKEKFANLKGTYRLSLIHEDSYFNMPVGLRDFKKSDEALRIRKSIEFQKNNFEKNSEWYYFLTYKGKKIDNTTKTRQEIELKMEDGDKMKEILKVLGFQEVITVKKERELYEFTFKDHHIEVLIDYLPILKENFMEVEYTTENEEKIEEVRILLFDFLKLLGIEKEESITKSYLELILEKFT